MMALPETVLAYSKHAAEAFIQTAVFIDDRIYQASSETVHETGMVVAPRSRRKASKSVNSDLPAQGETETATEEDDKSSDTYEIVNHFAKKQIVCSLYQPRRDASVSVKSEIFPLCKAADIVVIDWDLYGDKGAKAKELADGLIRQAVEDVPEQLRLILIYTGETNLQTVASELYEKVHQGIGDRFEVEEDQEGLVFRTENSRVVVRGKPGRTRPEPFQKFTVDEKDLADVAVAEFAKMASGLLHAATLLGLAEIRNNSRKILSKFNRDLDPAFITHLAMCLPHEHAASHVIPLLVSEIEAVLEDVLPDPVITDVLIKDWCANVWKPGPHLDQLFARDSLDHRAIAQAICTKGFKAAKEEFDVVPNPNGTKNVRKAAKILLSGEAADSNHRFSHLMSSRTFYGNRARDLRLGSIVHERDSDRYLLCLQPVCDSVRLEEKRTFVFAKMTKGDAGEGDPVSHNVLKENNTVQELIFRPKSFECLTLEFKPDSKAQKVIASTGENGALFFEDVTGKRFFWIDQLRTSHAQRAVERFANEFSRVGLTESDWLRRLDGK